ncbi:HAMP domain-containing sensor histidine kinase [Kitasatospora sp. GP82]|uniref:HAMP domain-containing sensor histidine kinase n=1 Tax=Kitasatospora sp. GP82 TaxID=3035089 RepID=UPI0024730522|nr:HAMP domain-containing sensor histidine kinase [Kitasatospora sp. GP82]MDH6126316.1 two-component system sensor histidine kinase MprB [Kitasatospora sp. GP82]
MKLLHRLTDWFRARSLRGRLAMLTAAAVAVTIALAALACWFLVSNQLYGQVQQTLREAPNPRPQDLLCGSTAQQALTLAETTAKQVEAGRPYPPLHGYNKWDIQLVAADGTVCLPINSTRLIQNDPADLDRLGSGPTYTYRDGSYEIGRPALIRQSPVTLTFPDGTSKPFVMLVANDTTHTQDSLRGLALGLLGVAGLGVVGAGLTGRLVARQALKPVDQLTDVVEHIARTEEVGTTIPVHGSDEIARLSASFNSMSTALANSRDRQTRLIADAGHELRTPLTSLRTNVDLLIRSDETGRPLPPATKTKLLGNMKAQMQELTLLIGDLLQLSRPDSPKPGQNLTVVALHEIATRAVDRAKLRGPGLGFEVAIDPWYVHGDAAALERAVINLLDNAVKYSPPGGTIDIALHQGTLTVRDRGPGIPPEELPYVFDRFWRSPSSRQLPGSGLGLSIVAQTVQDTGGEVALGPAPDGGPGTLATVRLPGAAEKPE